MNQDLKTIALERMYCIRIGDHTTAIVETEARELFELLRAEFEPVSVSIPIRPTDEGLDRLAADLGVTIPVTAPVSETPLLRHEGMNLGPTIADPFPEPGPTLNDDIEAMIERADRCPECGHATHGDVCLNMASDSECNCTFNSRQSNLDDADEQEEEFLSRLPKIAVASDVADAPSAINGTPVGELTLPPVTKFDPTPCCGAWPWCDCDGSKSIKHPSNTPEPPAEPETVAETPAPSNDRQVAQTWQDRLLELWAKYEDKSIPDRLKFLYSSTRNSRHPELRDMDTAGIRQALRSLGIDVPEPMTPQERAAMARAKRLAAAGERVEPPKVAEEPRPDPIEEVLAPMPLDGVVPEATVQLIHALTRSVRRRWPDDKASIKAHIADLGPLTQLSRVTEDQIAQFDARYQGWLDAYSAMPPFKQREVDASLLTEWKRVAA